LTLTIFLSAVQLFDIIFMECCIMHRRKLLWPYFQEARRQNKKKPYFKRDKLYIDGDEYIHRPNITQEKANRDSQQRRQYAAQGAHPRETVNRSFNGR
jgi:hypothetical protein